MDLDRFFSTMDGALPPAAKEQVRRVLVRTALLVPSAILLIGILWGVVLSGLAVQENIHFGQKTSQWVELLTSISDYCSKRKDKTVFDLEDIRNAITEAAIPANRNTDVLHLNSFGDAVVYVTMSAPNIVRLETEMPVRHCRRLSLYLANSKLSGALNVVGIEAATGEKKVWKNIYAVSAKDTFDPALVETACEGSSLAATLAILLKLK